MRRRRRVRRGRPARWRRSLSACRASKASAMARLRDELGFGRVQRREKSADDQMFRGMSCVPMTGQARPGKTGYASCAAKSRGSTEIFTTCEAQCGLSAGGLGLVTGMVVGWSSERCSREAWRMPGRSCGKATTCCGQRTRTPRWSTPCSGMSERPASTACPSQRASPPTGESGWCSSPVTRPCRRSRPARRPTRRWRR